MHHLTQTTAVKLAHILLWLFHSPLLILFPICTQLAPLAFVTLTCTLTYSDDPAGKSRNLLAIKTFSLFLSLSLSFFFFFKTKTTWHPRSAPSPPTHREREGGRSNSKMRGPALLSALRQETECERAARHHTEAPLKIHVYHSSSFIDGLSSLYVYEVRGLPVAPGQWPTAPPPTPPPPLGGPETTCSPLFCQPFY